jgi:hypothetical protein
MVIIGGRYGTEEQKYRGRWHVKLSVVSWDGLYRSRIVIGPPPSTRHVWSTRRRRRFSCYVTVKIGCDQRSCYHRRRTVVDNGLVRDKSDLGVGATTAIRACAQFPWPRTPLGGRFETVKPRDLRVRFTIKYAIAFLQLLIVIKKKNKHTYTHIYILTRLYQHKYNSPIRLQTILQSRWKK